MFSDLFKNQKKIPYVYNRKWRDKSDVDAPKDIKPAIRFKSKIDGSTVLKDLVQGDIEIENKNVEDFISTLSITTMPSIGWKRRQVMEEKGIEKCGDIKNWSEKDLAKLFNGDQIGKNLYEGIRGIGSNQLESFFQMQKSMVISMNFGTLAPNNFSCLTLLGTIYKVLI